MRIRAGYKISYDCPQPTPMILQVSVHPSRMPDLISWDGLQDFLVRDSGEPDEVVPNAEQRPLEALPVDALIFLLGSRYCETDRLLNTAWSLFGHLPKGWPLVQAICDYAHERIKFGYEHASPNKTAFDAFTEQHGVCRDYAHLAITLCRCMNVPARYCTGYLGDMGTEPPYAPGDFAAWFEAYLEGRWYTFDPRNNVPRLGRILMARGRDATDVAIVTSFGPCTLAGFTVITEEVTSAHPILT